MTKNMGLIDRTMRILVAIAIIILYLTNILTGTFGIVMIILSVIFVLTSLISFCPLYLPFKINTKKTKD